MKKYIKPVLYYEQFELSQNIAECGWDMNLTEKEMCYAYGDSSFGNEGFFILGSWCGLFDISNGENGTYCYQPGTDNDASNRVFNS